jgi:hypothetical protein
MGQRFAIGSVARFYLDLIVAGAGRTGQSPVIAVQRRADGSWFNAAVGTFQASFVANPMAELDSANLPGRYFFDFDHSRDLLVSTDFIVKKSNADTLVYDEIAFGPLPSVTDPTLCSVVGAVIAANGKRVAGTLVQATLIPVRTDALGRGYESDAPVRTYTAQDGSFDLSLVRGTNCRLEIAAVGYDRRAQVPDQPSVLFTNL